MRAITFVTAVASFCIPLNSGGANESLFGRTYIVTYKSYGSTLTQKFYVSAGRTIYWFSQNSSKYKDVGCGPSGSSAKLNEGPAYSSYTCKNDGFSMRADSVSEAKFSADTVVYVDTRTFHLRSGPSTSRYEYSFSFDGKSCKLNYVRIDGSSLQPKSCQVLEGRVTMRSSGSVLGRA